MSTTTGDPLAAARAAVARLEWEDALRLFEADASVELGPEDLEAMAQAAWWAMRPDDAIDVLERAYAGFVRANDNADARGDHDRARRPRSAAGRAGLTIRIARTCP
jgi:hypothetical protein